MIVSNHKLPPTKKKRRRTKKRFASTPEAPNLLLSFRSTDERNVQKHRGKEAKGEKLN